MGEPGRLPAPNLTPCAAPENSLPSGGMRQVKLHCAGPKARLTLFFKRFTIDVRRQTRHGCCYPGKREKIYTQADTRGGNHHSGGGAEDSSCTRNHEPWICPGKRPHRSFGSQPAVPWQRLYLKSLSGVIRNTSFDVPVGVGFRLLNGSHASEFPDFGFVVSVHNPVDRFGTVFGGAEIGSGSAFHPAGVILPRSKSTLRCWASLQRIPGDKSTGKRNPIPKIQMQTAMRDLRGAASKQISNIYGQRPPRIGELKARPFVARSERRLEADHFPMKAGFRFSR